MHCARGLTPGPPRRCPPAAARARRRGRCPRRGTRPRRAQLTSALTITEPGVYRTAQVTFYAAVKVTAEVAVNGVPTFFTHDGPVSWDPGRNALSSGPYQTAASTLLTTGPAEEAVVMMITGGNAFEFQTPFEITQQDIANQTQFEVGLTFDPEKLAQAWRSPGGTGAITDAANNGFSIPWPTLTPLPHRAGEQIVREKYVGTYAGATANMDVRLQFFSLAGDPDRKVLGVDNRWLVNASSAGAVPDNGRVRAVRVNADGSIDLFSDGTDPIIAGFHRGSAVGDHVQVSACFEPACAAPVQVDFELVSLETLP